MVEEKKTSWMNSHIGKYAGISFLVVGIGTCEYLSHKGRPEPEAPFVGCLRSGGCYTDAPQPVVVHRQLIGREQPDICIVKDGVTYCSQVDGMDLNDLLDDYYQQRGEE